MLSMVHHYGNYNRENKLSEIQKLIDSLNKKNNSTKCVSNKKTPQSEALIKTGTFGEQLTKKDSLRRRIKTAKGDSLQSTLKTGGAMFC